MRMWIYVYVCIPGRGKHSLHTLDILETALSPPSLDVDNFTLLEVEDTILFKQIKCSIKL